MSNSYAKSRRSAAKDARQTPAQDTDRQKSGVRKRLKPWILEYRYPPIMKDWAVFGRYETEKTMLMVLERESIKRTGSREVRVKIVS